MEKCNWDYPESFIGERVSYYGHVFVVDRARGKGQHDGEVRDAMSGDWYKLDDVAVVG